jgi:hypothetical protein
LTIANILSAASAQNPAFIIHQDTFGISAFSMTDLEICAQVFELEPANYAQLMASHPQGITLKSQSYVYGSGSLPALSGAGTYDIVYPHKLQSIKQFVMAVAPTNAIEGPLYAGVNPNLSTFSLGINQPLPNHFFSPYYNVLKPHHIRNRPKPVLRNRRERY